MANGPIKDLVRKVRKKRATGGHSEPTVTKDKFQKRRRRSVVKTKGQDKPNVLYSGEGATKTRTVTKFKKGGNVVTKTRMVHYDDRGDKNYQKGRVTKTKTTENPWGQKTTKEIIKGRTTRNLPRRTRKNITYSGPGSRY